MPPIPTRCVSSHLMTRLLTWRNPECEENYGLFPPNDIGNIWKLRARIVVAEVGLAALALIAAIETVAYGTLAKLSRILLPTSTTPFHFFNKLAESSTFTCIWSLADFVIYNIFYVSVVTHEPFARFSTPLSRHEDRWYCNYYYQINQLYWTYHPDNDSAVNKASRSQESIDQGAEFIVTEVLKDAPDVMRIQFKEMAQPSQFVLAKAVYIYAIGSKRDEPIPDFFKPATKSAIEVLRRGIIQEEHKIEMERLMSGPEEFNGDLQNASTQKASSILRAAASSESRGGLFSAECWQKARENFPE